MTLQQLQEITNSKNERKTYKHLQDQLVAGSLQPHESFTSLVSDEICIPQRSSVSIAIKLERHAHI